MNQQQIEENTGLKYTGRTMKGWAMSGKTAGTNET